MRNALLTGSSGFLGKIIQQELAYDFQTIGRHDANIECDLSKNIPLLSQVPEIVIHAAGKAHIVPSTEAESRNFFDVNVKGTENLLKGLEVIGVPRSFVFISSVSVYGAITGNLIKESHPLQATDSYGKSKVEAERLIETWCRKHGVICTILRLPLIAGINPPGNLGTMIRGIEKGFYFDVAGGTARKSIVLAEDVVRIIPKAAEVGGVFNLTDGDHPMFSQLSAFIAQQLLKNRPWSIPLLMVKGLAIVGDVMGENALINSNKLRKIVSDLTFDDSKARMELDWNPTPILQGFKFNK